jgi:hypothetical protein
MSRQSINQTTAAQRLDAAIEALFLNDKLLLEYDVSERTIAAKLAHYLTGLFPGSHVDVEYNRHGVEPKTLAALSECDRATALVSPDIVIHQRGTDNCNVLAIEIKKNSSREPLDCDRNRLREFRAQLGYSLAALVVLPVGSNLAQSDTCVEWI